MLMRKSLWRLQLAIIQTASRLGSGMRCSCRNGQRCLDPRHLFRASLPEPRCEMKGASLARLALHPDSSSKHFCQAPGNREPQAGAAIVAGGGAVCLRERPKDLLLLLQRNADARVAHRESRGHMLVVFRFLSN